ncbi:hypothetical protein APHAL10511_008133 [Amanita phalloides]|nr:hypothetical protein APHAL10511_008133 [Amanita phalloides]
MVATIVYHQRWRFTHEAHRRRSRVAGDEPAHSEYSINQQGTKVIPEGEYVDIPSGAVITTPYANYPQALHPVVRIIDSSTLARIEKNCKETYRITIRLRSNRGLKVTEEAYVKLCKTVVFDCFAQREKDAWNMVPDLTETSPICKRNRMDVHRVLQHCFK